MTGNPLESVSVRIACVHFQAREVDALRRLLVLLTTHLHRPWMLVADSTHADVILVNLEEGAAAPSHSGARVVGCASKPKQHARGTLYWPPRAYELLALLNELPPPEAASLFGAATTDAEWSYRLRSWPAQFSEWPREWWKVLAAIRTAHMSVHELELRTGVGGVEVRRCIDELERLDLLDREQERPSPQRARRAAPDGWRKLADRLGQLLGFVR
ncbi:MAG: hypothetical protein GXC76_15820 [Rhodanobacteraceae bacterium]|jgi:hypothetical protein|nr:hypothetical protein [Rhodanobacteraceae bacterium]